MNFKYNFLLKDLSLKLYFDDNTEKNMFLFLLNALGNKTFESADGKKFKTVENTFDSKAYALVFQKGKLRKALGTTEVKLKQMTNNLIKKGYIAVAKLKNKDFISYIIFPGKNLPDVTGLKTVKIPSKEVVIETVETGILNKKHELNITYYDIKPTIEVEKNTKIFTNKIDLGFLTYDYSYIIKYLNTERSRLTNDERLVMNTFLQFFKRTNTPVGKGLSKVKVTSRQPTKFNAVVTPFYHLENEIPLSRVRIQKAIENLEKLNLLRRGDFENKVVYIILPLETWFFSEVDSKDITLYAKIIEKQTTYFHGETNLGKQTKICYIDKEIKLLKKDNLNLFRRMQKYLKKK